MTKKKGGKKLKGLNSEGLTFDDILEGVIKAPKMTQKQVREYVRKEREEQKKKKS